MNTWDSINKDIEESFKCFDTWPRTTCKCG